MLEIAPGDAASGVAKSAVAARGSNREQEPCRTAETLATLGAATVEERRSHLDPDRRSFSRALIGVAVLALPGSPLHKDADARPRPPGRARGRAEGGAREGRASSTRPDLDRSVEIMRERVDKIGVSEPEIRKQGSDQIVDRAPRRRRPAARRRAHRQDGEARALRPPGDLVRVFARSPGVPDRAQRRLFDAAVGRRSRRRRRATPQRLARQTSNRRRSASVVGPTQTREELLSSKYVKDNGKRARSRRAPTVLAVPENMVVITCGETERYCPGVNGCAEPARTTTSSSTTRRTRRTRSRR